MTGGSPDVERETLDEFRADQAQSLVLLRQAIQALDHENCTRLAHRGKGACKMIGAGTMAEQFATLEAAARANAARDVLERHWQSLQSEGRRLEQALSAAIDAARA